MKRSCYRLDRIPSEAAYEIELVSKTTDTATIPGHRARRASRKVLRSAVRHRKRECFKSENECQMGAERFHCSSTQRTRDGNGWMVD